MPAPPGKVPILQSVRAGLAFVRVDARRIAPIVLAGASAATIAAGFGRALGPLLVIVVQGVVYAALLRIALAATARPFLSDAARFFLAMGIVTFFVLLIFLLATIAASIAMAPTLASYQTDLAAAQGDFAATNAILERIVRENPTPSLIVLGILFVVWLALTSRVYLVAPATIAEGRVRTFDTWSWTNGAMLRISASRVALILSATILLGAIQAELLQTLGATSPALLVAIVFAFSVASCVVMALEAGLSAFLYRGLRQA